MEINPQFILRSIWH